jgi:signal transduction histidine kinase
LLYSMHLKSRIEKSSESDAVLVDKIVNTINHLIARVEQILGFARPLSLTLRSGNVNKTIKEVLELLLPQINANKIELDLSLSEEAAMGLIDETSIRGSLMNILLNAIEAMPQGGRLSVTSERKNDMLSLEIVDTGPGISEEDAKKIFEPFYTTKEQGLGLGMPYARKIIEQHGGTISVSSKVGEGTRIVITVPASQKDGHDVR